MNTTTLIIVAIIVVVAVVLVGLVASRSRLKGLPAESRRRYAESWMAIETRFVDDPKAAVAEADQLAVAILQERGKRLDNDKRVPADLAKARQATQTEDGAGGTEGLRNAMLHYQRIVDDGVGASTRKEAEGGTREIAS